MVLVESGLDILTSRGTCSAEDMGNVTYVITAEGIGEAITENESSTDGKSAKKLGLLTTHINSSTYVEMTWKIPDFLDLPDVGRVSDNFQILGGQGMVGLCPYGYNQNPGLTCFTVALICDANTGIRNSEVDCEVALKTVDGKLYNSLMEKDDVASGPSACGFFRYFERSDILERKESLVPGGVLTVSIKVRSRENAAEGSSTLMAVTPTTLEPKAGTSSISESRDDVPTTSRGILSAEEMRRMRNAEGIDDFIVKNVKSTIGLLTTRIVSPTDIEITWKISDFFNLPNIGRASDKFDILGGQGMILLNSHGYLENPGLTCFTVVLICEADAGIRNPEVDCEVALKTVDGKLYNSLMEKDEVTAGPDACAFYRYFERSDIVERKESLVPGGVLTACIKVRSRENAADSDSRDDDFEGILKELRISGRDKGLTIKVDGREFRTYMSILVVRTPVFAAEIQKRITDPDMRVINIDDLCSSSAFQAFLQFVNTGQVQLLSTDTAFELYVMADKFKVDELKEQCAKYAVKDNSIPEIYVG